MDPLTVCVLLDVPHFVLFGAYPTQLAAGFLLDLNPFVHVRCKQTFDTLVLWEMAHLVDLDDGVFHLYSLDHLRRAPRLTQRTLLWMF